MKSVNRSNKNKKKVDDVTKYDWVYVKGVCLRRESSLFMLLNCLFVHLHKISITNLECGDVTRGSLLACDRLIYHLFHRHLKCSQFQILSYQKLNPN